MISSFCKEYLNEEFENYALKLCDNLSRKKKINILRGQQEIWAASVIYVIARLNFLFDPENDDYITPDIICDFFKTNKSTVGNKATQIEKACNLTLGAEGYCSQEIRDVLTFYETPEGFILPKRMIEDKEIVVQFVKGEEAEELERFAEEQRRLKEQKEEEKRKKRAQINRENAMKKSRNKNQLDLLDDL